MIQSMSTTSKTDLHDHTLLQYMISCTHSIPCLAHRWRSRIPGYNSDRSYRHRFLCSTPKPGLWEANISNYAIIIFQKILAEGLSEDALDCSYMLGQVCATIYMIFLSFFALIHPLKTLKKMLYKGTHVIKTVVKKYLRTLLHNEL